MQHWRGWRADCMLHNWIWVENMEFGDVEDQMNFHGRGELEMYSGAGDNLIHLVGSKPLVR
jgi:hypothetical protein